MANEENLKKGQATRFRSGEEAARNGQKGGIASGASRRRKKTMQQTVTALLGAGLDAGESEFVDIVRPRLLALGVNVEDATYQDVLLAGIMLKAMKGDVRAAEFIRDTVGENPSLVLKKKELQLRKNELKFKQEQAAEQTKGTQTIAGEAALHQIDLGKVSDEELARLDEIIGKILTG